MTKLVLRQKYNYRQDIDRVIPSNRRQAECYYESGEGFHVGKKSWILQSLAYSAQINPRGLAQIPYRILRGGFFAVISASRKLVLVSARARAFAVSGC